MTAGFDGLDGFKKRVPYAREQASSDRRWELVGASSNLHFVLLFFGAKPFVSSLYWLQIV